ncbi:hypothetical protein DFH08DRAFT_882605 [Mycena albidolilacea]|uniref:Uncharacterized protein n=1 Tax=Mycena albidolilacea TaxID=1033008 RepID=A0AAD7EKS9_9AGAR|nr:hypothetical protein DFH08DRAFT_882605 [Mycena albidolilacea]
MQGGDSELRLAHLEGEVYQLRTDYAESRHIHELILQQSSAMLSPVTYAYNLVNIVSLDLLTGTSTDLVSHHLDAAADAFQTAQFPRGILLCQVLAVDLKVREGDKTGAHTEYIRAFAGAYSNNDDELSRYCLCKLADSTHPVHADSEIKRWAVVLLAFTMRPCSQNMLAVHQAMWFLGNVLAQQDADDEALSILTVALEGFTWMDVHCSRAECMRTLGEVHFKRGEFHRASIFWMEARPLFERSLQAQAVAEIDCKLADLERHLKRI